ncbi:MULTISPECIES: endolytic transglycosylase MltG [Streptomyces]|uniref:endolytic transglycosylase MltG n=1 Tax=Streptomyces TaxID=1883 RepID=UPI00069952E0|nr:endolytic transglycosylase MltG [Streptomyces sp. SID7805]MYU55725.1 endolytic transglycosylase MltG [Streptomyces sp. SID7805]
MTEYGRGYGSEPWHPEDPLYGDQGPYGGREQQPQWGGPQSAPHPQHQYNGDWHGVHGAQQSYDPYDPYGQQQPPVDPYHGATPDYYGTPDAYPPPQPQHGRQQPQQQQPYPQQQPPQYPQQGQHPQHPQQEQYPQHPQQGQHPQQEQYGQQEQYPQQEQYSQSQHPQQTGQPYPDGAGDDWRAEPDRVGAELHEPQLHEPQPHEPEPREPKSREREPEPAFFAGDGDGEDETDARPAPRERRRDGRERRGKKNKRRSGVACLVVTVAIAGVVGTVGYFGYDFYESHFAPPPDFEGDGSGAVQVEIPSGALVSEMGGILKRAGVVKSAGAFTRAVEENNKAKGLPGGVYSLRKEMSGAAAVELMLDPKSRNGLTISEGLRASAVYELIDKKLNLKAGTTKDVAVSQVKNLGLPSWANSVPNIKDPLDGFLYPSTYSVGEKAKPVDVLKQMVNRATHEYEKYDLPAKAEELHLKSPLELLTVASLTQAEGRTHDDFRKMAAVIYNRLSPTNVDSNQKLEFDSTFNYLKNQSKINISLKEIRNYPDPYNTYRNQGLPPGPIGNPGAEALKAVINPDNTQKWLYFVSVDGKTTDFTTNLADHEKLVEKFNERQKKN